MDVRRASTVFRSPMAAGSRRSLLRRSAILAPGLALLVALLLAGPALSAVRIGTNGNDTLIGTTKNDQITGKGGNDTLIGKAGNDRYIFADNWGTDTVTEKASEGIDTADFHGVKTGPVRVNLVPEWVNVDPTVNANGATGPNGEVRFAYEVNGQTIQSTVENAIGGQGNGDSVDDADSISGGAGRNVLQPGGGGLDVLADIGGWNDGAGGRPEIPASNDVYQGFATNTGTDFIEDFGGNGDVLDLRPFSTEDVFVTAIDFLDGDSVTFESLQIVTGLTGQIIIFGQFGEFGELTAVKNYHGHIETIRFANKTFSTISATQSLGTASTEATSAKQARLAAVAEGLAKEARALVDQHDPLGLDRALGGEGGKQSAAGTSADEHPKHEQDRKRKGKGERRR